MRLSVRPHTPASGYAVAALAAAAMIGSTLPFVTRFVELNPIATDVVLVALIACVALMPIVIRAARRRLEYMEPLIPASAAMVLLFVARPIADIVNDNRRFAVNVDLASTYADALVVVLVAVLGFELGYFLSISRTVAHRVPRPPDRVSDSVLIAGALVLTMIAGLALAVRGVLAGGVGTLLQDRSQFSGDATVVPIVSESVMVGLPAMLLLWSVRGSPGLARVLSALPLALLLIAALPGGDRRYLLEITVASSLIVFLRSRWHPSPPVLICFLLLSFFLVIAPLRQSRLGLEDYPSNVVTTLSDPGAALGQLLRVGDTEMVDNIAYELREVGDDLLIPWQFGLSSVTESILQPIPRQVWPDKPETVRTQIISARWGMVGGRCVGICPVFSVVGTFYADGGAIAVFIGSLLIGVLFRAWYEYFVRSRASPIAQIAYSSTLFAAFYVWWSSLSVLTLAMGLFVAPVVLIGVLGAARRPAPSRTREA